MPAKLPWGRQSQFSIGGIEVVPATGLEVAFDDSPEVVTELYSKPRRKYSFSSRTFKNIKWRRKVGMPGFWMGMGVAVFGLGIAAGVIFALLAAVKARDEHATSLAQTSSASVALFSVATEPSAPSPSPSNSSLAIISTTASSTLVISTFSRSQSFETSKTTSSILATISFSSVTSTAGSSTLKVTASFRSSTSSSTSTTSTVGSIETSIQNNSKTTNFQTFTGALGGAHAIPITATGNSQTPFNVEGTDFPDLPSAASHSCILQRQTCEGISDDGSGQVTVAECLTQFSQCVAATPGATG